MPRQLRKLFAPFFRLIDQAPPTLLDYLPSDALLFIDESHQTIPQIGGMYHGDRSRKENLVKFGFTPADALDNRPLTLSSRIAFIRPSLHLTHAEPAELTKTSGVVVEQIIRPTGLLDPEVDIKPIRGQVDDLLHQIRLRVERNERVLVTTLTKRMSEDLSEHYTEAGVKCAYLRSEVSTLDRVKILRDLRRGTYDVLIGVNLLREGLDLPEVSLVAVLDADKEGFLRSAGSLIQTMGRAARNVNGPRGYRRTQAVVSFPCAAPSTRPTGAGLCRRPMKTRLRPHDHQGHQQT